MWTNEEIQVAFQKISKKAMTDKNFRDLCLKDAAKAVKEATGKELPSGFTVKFVENHGADVTFVLPDFIENSNELDEKELEAVAGGSGIDGKYIHSPCGLFSAGPCRG